MSNEIATKSQRNSNNHIDLFESRNSSMNKQQYVLAHGSDKLKIISTTNGCIALLTNSNGMTKCNEFNSLFKNARHMAEWLIHDGWKLAGNGDLKP